MLTCDLWSAKVRYHLRLHKLPRKYDSCLLAGLLSTLETDKGHSLGIVVSSPLQNVSRTAKLPPYGSHKGSAKTPRVLTRAPSPLFFSAPAAVADMGETGKLQREAKSN